MYRNTKEESTSSTLYVSKRRLKPPNQDRTGTGHRGIYEVTIPSRDLEAPELDGERLHEYRKFPEILETVQNE